jgi:hypothetical protein
VLQREIDSDDCEIFTHRRGAANTVTEKEENEIKASSSESLSESEDSHEQKEAKL